MANLLKIKEVAKAKKIPLKTVAESIGMTPVALSNMMQKGSTNTSTLEKIASVLGESPAIFFDDTKHGEDFSMRDIENVKELINGKNISGNNINNSRIIEKAIDEIGEHRKLIAASHENVTSITKALIKMLNKK